MGKEAVSYWHSSLASFDLDRECAVYQELDTCKKCNQVFEKDTLYGEQFTAVVSNTG